MTTRAWLLPLIAAAAIGLAAAPAAAKGNDVDQIQAEQKAYFKELRARKAAEREAAENPAADPALAPAPEPEPGRQRGGFFSRLFGGG